LYTHLTTTSWEVERLILKDARLKYNKFKYKEEENSLENIATMKHSKQLANIFFKTSYGIMVLLQVLRFKKIELVLETDLGFEVYEFLQCAQVNVK